MGATRLVALIACMVLTVLMLITFVDVMGRYLFLYPLPGGIEITESLMIVLVYASFVAATAADEHVRADILLLALRQSIRNWLRVLGSVLTLAVAGVFTVALLMKSVDLFAYYDLTPVLRLPLYPVILTAGIMGLGFVLAAFVRAWADARSALIDNGESSGHGAG